MAYSSHTLHATSRLLVASITLSQVLSCVLQALSGATYSDVHSPSLPFHRSHMLFRLRDRLVSGEIAVKGDQWPMLVYQDGQYDPKNPWAGLFRSKLLVSVSYSHCLGLLHA